MKPLVYLASPYTNGDAGINTRFQCETWDKMMNDGIVLPYAPLWSHFQHTMFPRKYDDWMDYDLEIINRCDALIRLEADYQPLSYHVKDSKGADKEVSYATAHGKPVFYKIEDLYKWAEVTWNQQCSTSTSPRSTVASTIKDRGEAGRKSTSLHL